MIFFCRRDAFKFKINILDTLLKSVYPGKYEVTLNFFMKEVPIIDSHRKAVDPFLYDRDFRHERVNK